jgi:hypothetical protein
MNRLAIIAVTFFFSSTAHSAGFYEPLHLQVDSAAAAAEIEISFVKPKAAVRVVRWLRRPDASAAALKIQPCFDSKKKLAEWDEVLWSVHWRKVRTKNKGQQRQARARWKKAANAQLAMLRKAKKRGRVRAVVLLIKKWWSRGAPAVLGPDCDGVQYLTLEHWVDHPNHRRWRKRLMHLLKKRQ